MHRETTNYPVVSVWLFDSALFDVLGHAIVALVIEVLFLVEQFFSTFFF